MPIWFIQRIKSRALRNRRNLNDDNKHLFVGQIPNDIFFVAALHESAIVGVAQVDDDQ